MSLTYGASITELPSASEWHICWWERFRLKAVDYIFIMVIVPGMVTNTLIIRLVLWQQSEGGIFLYPFYR